MTTVALGPADVAAAAGRIAPHVHHTPVLTSATLDDWLGAQVFFKCENLQKTGAFKARGAVNAVLALDDDEAARGVVTHSSGNHGAALSYAASIRGIPCTIVVPDDAPQVKQRAIEGYGGRIVPCRRPERDAALAAAAAKTGSVVIHPFEHPHVIAGQGTATAELVAAVPDLDMVVAPVGGGGLLSGTSIAAHGHDPAIQLIGAEPEAAPSAYESLRAGHRVETGFRSGSVADALLGDVGERAFAIFTQERVRVVTVSDEELLAGGRFFVERMKLVVEPSGAAGLAALAKIELPAGGRIGVIVSGGNTTLDWLDHAPAALIGVPADPVRPG